MYCGIGECRLIPVHTHQFVQFLNSNGNHWVIIYAVNCVPGELQVYDSLNRTMSKDIKDRPPMMMQCTPKYVFPILMRFLFD